MPQTYDILTTSTIIKIEGVEYWIKVKKINPTLTALSIQEIENMYSIKDVNNFPASNG